MCAETGTRIKQLFLRSCSPNHNLIECQWKVLKFNPQMIPCAEKLKDFILSCSNFRLSFSEKNIHAKIEEGNGVYVIRLFEYGTGPKSTSTQGCLILNANDKSLKDVTLRSN